MSLPGPVRVGAMTVSANEYPFHMPGSKLSIFIFQILWFVSK